MPSALAGGWLPATIAFDARPAVLPEAAVRWIEFGGAKLRAPLFDGDVTRLRLATPRAREAETDIATLLRAASRLPEVRPAGIIVHISPSGSAAIASALRGAARTVVLSEPQPIASLLFPQGYSPGRWLRSHWDRVCDAVLPALLSLYAHYRTGKAERVVIQLPSASLLNFRAIRARWPETPCAIVVRDPVEVMVAGLRGSRSIETAGAGAAMSREESAAKAVARFLESAVAGFDDRCLVLDHEDINETRVRGIASRFGLELPHGAVRRIHPDAAERTRRLAGREVLDAAQRWAMRPYFDLRAR